MNYTDKEQVSSFILIEYLDAVEMKKEGILTRTIAEVSAEIDCLLGVKYQTPFEEVPDIIKYIASVLSAYRIVSSLTSLVDTEASTNNIWIPLQKEWQRALKLLDDIATGITKLKNMPLIDEIDSSEELSFLSISDERFFDLDGF